MSNTDTATKPATSPAGQADTTPLFNLSGRVALVTGSGQGMGLGAVRALCRQGARVVINDFYPERAESAAAALTAEGFSVCAAPGDITLPEVREQIVAIARSTFGEIDILVNNAGVPPGMPSSLTQFKNEVGREGVTANALSLGCMNNFGYDEIAKRTTAVGRAGTADDVGAAVVYLASSEASWMSGQVIALNGGSCTA